MKKSKEYVALIPYYGKLKVNKILAYDTEDTYEQTETNSPGTSIILTIKESYQLGRKLTSLGAIYNS